MTALAVVAGYEARAQFARAEVQGVARPRLLDRLLSTARHVAEIPSGAGHFLADYLTAAVEVTLIDGSVAMMTTALAHAATVGLPADRTHHQLCLVQDLGHLPQVDAVIIPNAALNQLAHQSPLTTVLATIRAALAPGARLLAQVICRHSDQYVDACGFYDPSQPHGQWFIDRELSLADGAVVRRRRQHVEADELRVEFAYSDRHTTTVCLRILSVPDLLHAMDTAGFTRITFLPGHERLSEILATVPAARS